jgi:hypothetical protein
MSNKKRPMAETVPTDGTQKQSVEITLDEMFMISTVFSRLRCMISKESLSIYFGYCLDIGLGIDNRKIGKPLSARKRAKVKENNEVYGSLCNLERIIFDMEYLDWIPFCKNTFTLIIADKKSAMAALAAIADYARMLFPVIKGRKKYVYADYITIRPPTSTYKKSKCTPMSYAMAHNPFYIVSRAGSSGTQPVAMLNPKKLKKAISKKLAIREMRILKSVYDKILYFELSSLQKDCFDGDPFFIWRKYEHKYEKHYYGYGEN